MTYSIIVNMILHWEYMFCSTIHFKGDLRTICRFSYIKVYKLITLGTKFKTLLSLGRKITMFSKFITNYIVPCTLCSLLPKSPLGTITGSLTSHGESGRSDELMFWNDFFEFGVQLHINSWLGETIPEFDSFWKEGLGKGSWCAVGEVELLVVSSPAPLGLGLDVIMMGDVDWTRMMT